MTDKVTRKLMAILSADVKGYSILMADDEAFTIETLKKYRGVMANCIEQHSGRVVDSPGDNLLADFGSAVDAVECAVEIQKKLKKKNAKFVEGRRLEFRIGINIGDVLQDGDRIYGSGVNIAARIEGISDPGGICISRSAYDQVKGKVDLNFRYFGEHEVKNIEDPVRVYKALLDSEPPKHLIEEELELPDKPSIAVLPFTNMSGDPSQEYFSDGLTEQIINGLCKVSSLFVIARNSSFAYKGKSISVKHIAKELGVRYILEGSVQKAGDRVRITAQLIDAVTDYHMWSEHYDRELEDIFAMQDEITGKLISAMDVQLIYGEQANLWDIYRGNIQAYDKFMRGLEYALRGTKQDNFHACTLLKDALSIEETATGYATLGHCHIFSIFQGWSDSVIYSFEQAERCAEKALELDASLDVSHRITALIHLYKRKFDTAKEEGELAIKLNPNGAEAYAGFAFILLLLGELEAAIEHIKKAIRLNPIPPSYYYLYLGFIYMKIGQYNKAIDASKKALSDNPNQPSPFLVLAFSFTKMNKPEEAKKAVKEILRLDPNFSLDYYAMTTPFKKQTDLDDFIKTLHKAGLPD